MSCRVEGCRVEGCKALGFRGLGFWGLGFSIWGGNSELCPLEHCLCFRPSSSFFPRNGGGDALAGLSSL